MCVHITVLCCGNISASGGPIRPVLLFVNSHVRPRDALPFVNVVVYSHRGEVAQPIVVWTPVVAGDVPTYLAFMAATVAATVAWIAYRRQAKAFAKQENNAQEQLRLLGIQVDEQKRAFEVQLEKLSEQIGYAAEDSRHRLRLEERSQVVLVSAWPGDTMSNETFANLLNRSGQPVYGVVVNAVLVQGAGPRKGEELPRDEQGYLLGDFIVYSQYLSTLPDGEWHIPIELRPLGMSRKYGVEIAFTDFQGAHWIRRAYGDLERITTDALTYFKLPLPLPDAPLRQGYSNRE